MKFLNQKKVGEFIKDNLKSVHLIDPINSQKTICNKRIIGPNFGIFYREKGWKNSEITSDITCENCMLNISNKKLRKKFEISTKNNIKQIIYKLRFLDKKYEILLNKFDEFSVECPFNTDTLDEEDRLTDLTSPCQHPENKEPGCYTNCNWGCCPIT